MIRIPKKLDYALAILVHMAECGPDGCASAKEVAARYKLPLPITASLLKSLAKTGMIVSIRGAKGGYALAVPPRTITLDKVIVAIDGPMKLADCVSGPSNKKPRRCLLRNRCPVTIPVRRLHDSIFKLMSEITLERIAGDCTAPPELTKRRRLAAAEHARA